MRIDDTIIFMNTLRRKLLPFLLVLLLIVDIVIWYVYLYEDRQGILTVSFLDVGQGDAIFIDAPNGNQLLLDGGVGSAVLRQLSTVTPFYDRTIDVLVASHADQDHIGGFPNVLRRFNVATVIEGGTRSDTAVYESLEGEVDAENSTHLIARAGEKIILDKKRGVIFTTLFPDRDVSGLETNTGSIVGILSYGNICFMLTGDSPIAIEEYMVSLYGNKLHCQVLKVGHHGSKTSSSQKFVAAVAPSYAVISAGKDNKYGHPNQETLDTLTKFGVDILRTDELGTITFATNGVELWKRK